MSFSVILLVISIIWVSSEIILARMRRSGSKHSAQDKRSFRIIWITIAICVNLGNTLGFTGVGVVRMGKAYIAIAGLTFIVLGLIIRWTAILTLKSYFTVDVSIADDHRLVTRGIYRVVRHPAYTGSLLSFLGLGLVSSSWVAFTVIFIPILLAFLNRIRIEEKVLLAHFGDDYVRYCDSTKRLIPIIY